MKIKIDDLSGLPEGLKSVVSEDGELDLKGVAPMAELDRYKGKALTAEQEAIERRQQLKDWKALGESPAAVREAIEAAKGGKNEDHERIIADMKSAHEAEKAELAGKLDGLYKRTSQESLKAELAKAGVVAEGLDLLASFAAARIKFNEDGTPRVMAEDGQTPMVGSAANGGATLADLAKQLADNTPHLVKDGGKGGGGKQPGSNGGTPDVKRSEMSAADKSAFIQEHGQAAYLKLPK